MAFDAAWHERALSGDPIALKSLADKVLEPLYRFVFYRVGGRAELAEEAVQETMLKAVGGLDRFEPDRGRGDILPWLRGLARNEIRRVLGRFRDAAPLEHLWERVDKDLLGVLARFGTDVFADEVLDREETRQLVGATMAQLPEHYRLVLEAKYLEGRSVRDLADGTDETEKTVESRLTRARRAFKEVFLSLTRNLQAGVASPAGEG